MARVRSTQLIKVLAVYSVLTPGIPIGLTLLSPEAAWEQKVGALMGLGIIVFWCIIGGGLMYRYREAFKKMFECVTWRWQYKFVFFATLFAPLEEAVTVSLTNMAPLLGVSMEVAHATASANYFHTVLGNSVLLFLGWFVAWAWLLTRYDFPKTHTFLLFGLLGAIAESSFGVCHLFVGFWFFVYGLMIFLPLYAIPEQRPALKKPGLLHYGLAIVLPLLVMIPFGLLMQGYILLFSPVFF